MAKKKSRKKTPPITLSHNAKVVVWGVLTIIILGIILSTAGFFIYSGKIDLGKNAGVAVGILSILSFAIPIAGGFVVGRGVKKVDPIKYGFYLGVILVTASLLVALAGLLVAEEAYKGQLSAEDARTLAKANLIGQAIDAPLTIFFTTFGSWIGSLRRG